MPFDEETRKRLAEFVTAARTLVVEEFTEQLSLLYGILASGDVAPLESLVDLDDTGRAIAARIRDRIDYLAHSQPEEGGGTKEAVERFAREQAFTIVNRLAAIRMAEKRSFLVESVGDSYKSRGFKLFQSIAGHGLGDTYNHYRRFLFCLFDELALELGALFDRRSPQGLLFPREPALLALLALQRGPELEALWGEDETIGWIYQYYNDRAERKRMRKASDAPRNSRELAVRNQFFTPRYVVEFLTDNTLGRVWYEMRRGETSLTDRCRYLMRRPNELFLAEGEGAPVDPLADGTSQGELLRLTVHIPHRRPKDPRALRVLDPACGSMHFGLYCFDLLEVIYAEAWDAGHESLRRDFPERDALLREVPRLIIEHNLHGIDIDPRAAQIAGLALWLRAQQSWKRLGTIPARRPRVRRSNIVCAEPMPGEATILYEFLAAHCSTTSEQKLIGQLVLRIFEAMRLAGEAGSLLRIERDIAAAVAEAKQKWLDGVPAPQGSLFPPAAATEDQDLDVAGVADESFWEKAEEAIYLALKTYAEQAERVGSYQRRLFADDAARGFALIDLFRKRYDVVLMNPPFGAFAKPYKAAAAKAYPNSNNDIYAAFVERCLGCLTAHGRLGAITSRACFFTTSFIDWRQTVLTEQAALDIVADLGEAVMDDAMVEAAAYVLTGKSLVSGPPTLWLREFRAAERESSLLAFTADVRAARLRDPERMFIADLRSFGSLPGKPFVYWVDPATIRTLSALPHLEPSVADVRKGLRTGDNFRFVRCLWEVPAGSLTADLSPESTEAQRRAAQFVPLVLSGSSQPWFAPLLVALNWRDDGRELRQFVLKYGGESRLIQGKGYYFRPGISWTRRATRFVPYAIPAGCIPTGSRPMAFPTHRDGLLLLAITASNCASAFMRFYGEKFLWPNFLEGKVKLLPWPDVSADVEASLTSFVLDEITKRSLAYRGHEPFHAFLCPEPFSKEGDSTQLEYAPSSLLGAERESLIAALYGLAPAEASKLCQDLRDALATRYAQPQAGTDADAEEDEESDADAVIDVGPRARAESIISYALGCAFGRWDVRFATGQTPAPALTAPFVHLPACAPGLLRNERDLPLSTEDVRRAQEAGEWHYPLSLSWDGILLDEPGHALDIETCVHEVFRLIWGDECEVMERRLCELLRTPSVREYFHSPGGFFADHLRRYSRSKRQAPIYWPLSSASGRYTVWVYYQRLSEQTLHTALADYVRPKLGAIRRDLNAARHEGVAGDRVKELSDVEKELAQFNDVIERIIALPWMPNLNDGVLITASPLWRLFRHTKWQKDLKACWTELERGLYDWAHLAYSIWPARVEGACARDRSIAIAHDREHLCTVVAKPRRKSVPREVGQKRLLEDDE